MKKPGQGALVPFPRVDLTPGKPRPVLLLARVPGPYDDWLVGMFSTRLHQEVRGFDEVIDADASDFEQYCNAKEREVNNLPVFTATCRSPNGKVISSLALKMSTTIALEIPREIVHIFSSKVNSLSAKRVSWPR
jgi:hypothetical protein